jgi:hypothetical protein
VSRARQAGIELCSGYRWPEDRFQVVADRLDAETPPDWCDEQIALIAETLRTAEERRHIDHVSDSP